MLKNVDIKKPAIDAAIAVGGGALLGNIGFISDLLAKVPFLETDLMGVSLKAIVLGIGALVAAKYFMKG